MKIQHTMIAVALAALSYLSAFAQESSSDNTNVIAIKVRAVASNVLRGTITYSNEGRLGFYGEQSRTNPDNNVVVSRHFGDDWSRTDRWVIGGRDDRHVVVFNVSSNDNGSQFGGPIGGQVISRQRNRYQSTHFLRECSPNIKRYS